MRAPWPQRSPPGPFRREFWRSPLRGPWLTSFLGAALLPLIAVCALTGFLSHAAYNPDLGGNSITGPGSAPFDLYFFDWPTTPSWIYAATQGLHIISGVTAIPLLLAKLWSSMPKLFEWPPLRSPAHLLERVSLAMLVGGGLFVFFSGLFNIQLWYAWDFNFVAAHYYAAYVFLAGLVIHLVVKAPIALRAFRERGIVRPLRDDLANTAPEPPEPETTAPTAPAPPTVSRRWLLGTVGAASAGLGLMAAGQSLGGPFRELAFLAPRGRTAGEGPNDFLVNKTAASVGVEPAVTGPSWRLRVRAAGAHPLELDREQLLALPLSTHSLPIACVEGWSTTQDWTGVPLRALAEMAVVDPDRSEAYVESLQEAGSFRDVSLASNQVADERTLLALRVNNADLSLDHGFPARLIVPGAPGVHCTKWVAAIEFTEA